MHVTAVVLRVILTFFAVALLTLPYVQLIGALLLLWIGVKLVAEDEGGGEEEVQASNRLMSAIRTPGATALGVVTHALGLNAAPAVTIGWRSRRVGGCWVVDIDDAGRFDHATT